MINAIMHGCNGAMGRVVCNHIHQESEIDIVAGIDLTLDSSATFPIFANINSCDMPANVIIDFSTASAVSDVLDYAVAKNTPLVICTTGLNDDAIEKIKECSKKIAIFQSANMSLGINLLSALAKKAAALLHNAGFDIEIIEKHHNKKIDAPSGTAKLLANDMINALDNNLFVVTDRSQAKEKRKNNEIGISSIRGGTIIGEHSIIFAGADEIVELTHIAQSKEIFAKGSIEAAKFIANKPAGLYDMNDLIGEI